MLRQATNTKGMQHATPCFAQHIGWNLRGYILPKSDF